MHTEDATLDDDLAWQALLGDLLRDRDVLVDDFLLRLRESHTYAAVDIADTDLRQAASDTLELLLRDLAGLPISAALRAVPHELGARRARQGVPRESLMDAVRLDFRVLWAGLARAAGPAGADRVVRHAEDVLTTVESYIGDVQAAFLDEQTRAEHDSQATARRTLAALMAGTATPEDLASVIRMPVDAALDVILIAPDDRDRARRAIRREPGWTPIDLDDGLLVVRLSCPMPLPERLDSVRGARVDAVPGLAALPDAVRTGQRMLPHVPPGRICAEADVWLGTVSSLVAGQLGALRRPLEGLPAPGSEERRRLVEAVVRYCETGSVKVTAERLFCHRNTVVNRLTQFADLTGWDVAVPLDAAAALLALGEEGLAMQSR